MAALINRPKKSYKIVKLHREQSVFLTVLLVIYLLPCCNLMKLKDAENGKLKEDENGKLKEDDNDFYLAANGNWCGMCPAGEFVSKDCARNLSKAQCEKCARGTFSMFLDRATSCKECKTCEIDQDKITECTTVNDTVCVCRKKNFDYVPDLGCVPKPPPSSTPSTPTSVFPECPEGDKTRNRTCLPCSNCSTDIPPDKNETFPQNEILLYGMIGVGLCILSTIIICGFLYYYTKRHRNKKSISLGGEDGSECKIEMEPLNTSARNVQ
ncbi:hypothetical protein SNE40_015095 [Patella caerulea]|uniref:TNFR-Cys domain-containing protein n=1 Tax=Patella caerulea TaxID=87958 RepID=A0AAN8JEZ8_PATCE